MNFKFYLTLSLLGVIAILLFLMPFNHGIKALLLLIFYVISLICAIFYIKSILKQSESDISRIKAKKKKLNFEIQVSSSQIGSISEQIKVNLDESTHYAQNLFDETQKMNSFNNEFTELIGITTRKIKDLIQLLEEESNTINNMETISISSNEVIHKSLSEILNIVETINDIQISSSDTMNHMDDLLLLSKEIMSILEAVDNVSRQTHLLALNASIESARAGESGRGFAVVAEEIRKLALSTADSVKSINNLITNLQTAINNVYDSAKNNLSRVDKGVTLSANIEKNLSKIEQSFNQFLSINKSIKELKNSEVHLVMDIENNITNEENMLNISKKSTEMVESSAHKHKHSLEDFSMIVQSLNETSNNIKSLFDATEIQNLVHKNDNTAKAIENGYRILEVLSDKIKMLDKERHKEILEKVISEESFVEAVWTNEKKGRFICSIPEAGISNANVREWFKESIQGNKFMSEVYISAITRNPCITVSCPLKDVSGSIIGVVGLDIKIST